MKVCLVILDGWGHNPKKILKDAIEDSNCINMRQLSRNYASYLIHANGKFVGLDDGSMGNSEVGHLTLGAGRIVKQNIVLIDEAFKDGSIKSKLHPLLLNKNKTLHLIGMLSDGGIHSHIRHIKGLVENIQVDFESVFIHCISDGRDTAPDCFLKFYNELNESIQDYKNCSIASVGGRFYAMDRDNNEDRIDKYFDNLTKKKTFSGGVEDYIKKQYRDGKNDENLLPVLFNSKGCISSDDCILFCNFRADRMRQLTKKFINNKNLIFTLTEYDKNFNVNVLFKTETVKETLADVLEINKIEQVHIAETEKYAHVTYFFNGGNERIHKKEERKIIDSKKTESFADFPEMSSKLIADEVITNISLEKQFIVSNFAAPDMVGHTGSYDSTKKAVEFVDEQIGRIYKACKNKDYVLIITADHGNAEIMFDEKNNKTNKKHTSNKVPLIITANKKSTSSQDWGYEDSEYSLRDVSPTIINILNIKQPSSMTGKSIL
ncbi:hypothetical protein P3W45_000353 [Vairimorpha bombi]|jgi:2,3-bisphosphoglycerate-independent phosphoglycerate mutase